jgi:predicted aspartyl protease
MRKIGSKQRGSQDHPGEVRFRLFKPDHLIIVKGWVNGAGPFNLILDTGASMMVVTPEVARVAAIEQAGRKAKAVGAKGRLAARIVRVKSVRLGSVETRNLSAAIVSLSALSGPLRLELGGIIGYNLLRRYRITIDYRTRTLSFNASSRHG